MGVHKHKSQSKFGSNVNWRKYVSIFALLGGLFLVLGFGVFLNSAGPISGSNMLVNFTDLSPYGIHTEIGGREISSWEDL